MKHREQKEQAQASSPPCVLCGQTNNGVIDELSGRQIRALWNALGHQLSDRAMAPMGNDSRVFLFTCRSCGLRYYDPCWTGTGNFYEEMMQSAPYAESRPEFKYAIQFALLQRLRSVLDVGGGEGVFLDMARQKGLKTFGIELNRNAAAVSAQKGHSMIARPLNEVILDEVDGGVDLLTFFHVVEHVPVPRQIVIEGARLVKPGGFLMVSVPYEYRMLGLQPYDPANWPPHHISRWRHRDLARLCNGTGLRIVEIQGEVLHGRDIEKTLQVHNDLASAIARKTYPGGTWLPHAVGLLYRLLGCKYYFPKFGFTLRAVFQKEEAASVSASAEMQERGRSPLHR